MLMLAVLLPTAIVADEKLTITSNVEYYNKKAQGYLREAEYYSRHKNYDKVKTYQRWAVDATEKAESNSRYARKVRERARDYMRKAKNMLQKAE